jgi:hypothetical protein
MGADDLRIWLNHFEYHAEHPRQIPPELPDRLTAAERALISDSIATFQLGEQSEGKTLQRAAESFAQRHGLPLLPRITQLFIREEQRHATLLRCFMEDHAIALKQKDWTDRAFRRVRRIAGFELYLHVLICAELIGNVYYRALESATGCQRLKVLCRTLVADELAHIGFESQLLLELRSRRAAPQRFLLRMTHRLFFTGTACIVWLSHRSMLGRCGFGGRNFLRLCLLQYAFYLEPLRAPLAATPRA